MRGCLCNELQHFSLLLRLQRLNQGDRNWYCPCCLILSKNATSEHIRASSLLSLAPPSSDSRRCLTCTTSKEARLQGKFNSSQSFRCELPVRLAEIRRIEVPRCGWPHRAEGALPNQSSARITTLRVLIHTIYQPELAKRNATQID